MTYKFLLDHVKKLDPLLDDAYNYPDRPEKIKVLCLEMLEAMLIVEQVISLIEDTRENEFTDEWIHWYSRRKRSIQKLIKNYRDINISESCKALSKKTTYNIFDDLYDGERIRETALRGYSIKEFIDLFFNDLDFMKLATKNSALKDEGILIAPQLLKFNPFLQGYSNIQEKISLNDFEKMKGYFRSFYNLDLENNRKKGSKKSFKAVGLIEEHFMSGRATDEFKGSLLIIGKKQYSDLRKASKDST